MKGPDADRFAYTRDFMGSPTQVTRTAASRTIHQANQYDELSRIKSSFGYSTPLNVVPSRIHAWSLDSLGNWREFDDSNPALEQVRDVNNANEITDITETVGDSWYTPQYDAAGNMTRWGISSPVIYNGATYDAWNRLRQVSLISTALIRYEYDGLNRRTVADPTPLSSTPNNQYFYYNEDWQELEVRGEVSAGVQGADPLEQFVWHPYYIDALATRFYDVNFDGIDVEQHYFVHDANYNVTAAVDDTGAVVERYHYSAYGEISYRNPDFTAIGSGNSTIGNHTTYTGRRREPFGGIYHYRNRYYHPQLGKFLTRDPIGYEGSPWNLYQYVGGRPTSAVDPMGEADCQRLTVPSKKNIFGLLVCPKVTVGGKRIQAIKVRRIEYWPEKKPTVIIECMVPCGSLECPDPDCQDCIQVSLRSKGPFGVEIQLESCQCDPP